MSNEEIILKRLDRIDVKLNNLNKKSNKDHWVTATIVRMVTGWDYNQLKIMKREKVVEYDPLQKRYRLESIPTLFLKNQQTNTQ